MVIRSSQWSTLIIRVWLDEGAGMRARITEVDDAVNPERPAGVADDVEGVISATRAWLARFHPGAER
jgi:hypothetical protein